MSTPRLLTVKGAAEYLAVSTSTIRNWINAGLLPADRVGPRNLIRIKPEDLDKLVH